MARVTLEHAGRCLRGAPHTIGRIDQHEMPQRLDLVKDLRDFLPEIGPGKWRERHEYAGAGRFEQIADRFAFEQRIDRTYDAGRLPAPDHEMRFGKIGQHISDH